MRPGIRTRIGIPFQSGGSYWTQLISATVENAEPTKVVLTFDKKINGALPDSSAFGLYGKTISGISLNATNLILTITVTASYAYGDEIGNLTYIKPVSNPLKSTSGKEVDSFIYPVLNNISSTLATGLQVYWKLNEASGTRAATVGSLDLTESAVSVGTAKINKYDAAKFVLTDGKFLQHADNALLRGVNSDFTIAALIRVGSLAESSARGILGKYGFPVREYSVFVKQLVFEVVMSSDGTNTVGKMIVLDDANWVPVINTDYLVLIWYDSVNDLVGIQINNYIATTGSLAGGVFGSTNAFQIGAYNSSQFMNGNIALVAKWSKLLTTNEKRELWNNGIPLQYPFTRDIDLYSGGIKTKLLQKNSAVGTETYPARLNHQRQTFYAAGRYWAFYGIYAGAAPYHLYFITSTDGDTWSAITDLTTFPIADAQWSVIYDSTYVHIAKNIQSDAAPLFHNGATYRRGTPNSDGTITWDADWQTIIAAGTFVGDL